MKRKPKVEYRDHPGRNTPIRGERERILQLVDEDYKRRTQHWWGRFLLWVLRHTT